MEEEANQLYGRPHMMGQARDEGVLRIEVYQFAVPVFAQISLHYHSIFLSLSVALLRFKALFTDPSSYMLKTFMNFVTLQSHIISSHRQLIISSWL